MHSTKITSSLFLMRTFLDGWKHFGFDTYTTLNLELILKVYLWCYFFYQIRNKEFRISYYVVAEWYTFKKMKSKNNFCILQNIIDIPILLVIIWVNVGPLDVNYWHSRMVYDGLILSSITKSYIFVKAHSFEYYQVHFKHFYFKLSIFNFLIRKQLNHGISVYKDGIR